MSFDPRSIFNIEVASIAVILFSIALICYVLLSLAGFIVEFPDQRWSPRRRAYRPMAGSYCCWATPYRGCMGVGLSAERSPNDEYIAKELGGG